ncbi:MAG: TRAP transporter small permease [Planctomycetota bacterium]|jgi:TRAP-type C4-dicarboxylate transport system permease small subunit|nr:TRAP transporter small permease [Planctomycetota bacterium]
MKKILKILAAAFDGFAELFSSLALFAMFCVVIYGIYARTFTERPPFWGEELARYCMFYMVMLGSAIAIKSDTHPALTFLADFARGTWRFVIDVWVELVVLLSIILLFYAGWEMMLEARRARTASLRIYFSRIYFAIPLGCLLMGIATLRRLHAVWRRRRPLDKESAPGGS